MVLWIYFIFNSQL